MTSLSVLVPVYDEQHLVAASLARLELLEQSPLLERVEVIVVDDSSSSRSPEILAAFARERGIELAPAPPHAPRGAGRGPIEAIGAATAAGGRSTGSSSITLATAARARPYARRSATSRATSRSSRMPTSSTTRASTRS